MCAQYWPSSGSEMYGPFRVTLLSETQYADYVVREISVHVSGPCLKLHPFLE